ncbi:MAG: hypothetical protein A2284_08565 [Deltaproteobacteria bacterium RIFOXYA12_FULL_61_11]|nr:MAG: hypothetical protein A2284_08565 [Deltaproteobacteria bacterium RIFOXYA12_FULL_61_11]
MRRFAVQMAILLCLVGVLPLGVLGWSAMAAAEQTALREFERNRIVLSDLFGKVIEETTLRMTRQVDGLFALLRRNVVAPERRAQLLDEYLLQGKDMFLSLQVYETGGSGFQGSGPVAADHPLPEVWRDWPDGTLTPIELEHGRLPRAWYLRRDENFLLAAELDLVFVWGLIDGLKVGRSGRLQLIVGDILVAAGDPRRKRSLFRALPPTELEVLQRIARDGSGTMVQEGREVFVRITKDDRLQWTIIFTEDVEEAFEHLLALRSRLFWSLFLVGLVALGLGWLVSNTLFLRPVAVLLAFTSAIGRGQWRERPRVPWFNEIGQLGAALNTMTDQLEELTHRIRKGEREALLGRIASGLVHDLRKPLINIGHCLTLFNKKKLNTEERTLADILGAELCNLERFAQDLATLGTPRAPALVPVELHSFLERVLAPFRTGGCSIGLVTPPEQVVLRLDAFMVERALANLVKNAEEALQGRADGKVELRVEPVENEVLLVVEDNGPGMPLGEGEDPFSRYTSDKRRGVGLGLAIVKKIVESHGGEVTVISATGQGTCFTLRFPRS